MEIACQSRPANIAVITEVLQSEQSLLSLRACGENDLR
jgi:hypothetical protein